MPECRENLSRNKYTQYDFYCHALAQEPLTLGSFNIQFEYTLPWSSLLHI